MVIKDIRQAEPKQTPKAQDMEKKWIPWIIKQLCYPVNYKNLI